MGDSCSINGFRARSEDYPLCKAMVDHDHNRIKPRIEREVSDEINRELFEGEGNRGRDRTESCLKGRETEDEIGQRGGTVG